MPFLPLLAVAGSLIPFGLPADARLASPETRAEIHRHAEEAADRAVAEARAEVVAEARAEAAAEAESEAVTTVTAGDVRAGSRVHDSQGGLVGTVESVDAQGVVVATGSARAKLPFSSFGRNGRGLVISPTRAELEAAVAARSPS